MRIDANILATRQVRSVTNFVNYEILKFVKNYYSTYFSISLVQHQAKRKKKASDTNGKVEHKRQKNDEVVVVKSHSDMEVDDANDIDLPVVQVDTNQADDLKHNDHGTAASKEVINSPTKDEEGNEAQDQDEGGQFSPLALSPAKPDSKNEKKKGKSAPAAKKKVGRKKRN